MNKTKIIMGLLSLLFLSACSLDAKLLMSSKTVIQTEFSSNQYPHANVSSIPVKMTLSENVMGVTASHFQVAGATVTNFSYSNKEVSFDLVPASDGIVSVVFMAQSLEVPGGTEKKFASGSMMQIIVDRASPTVFISSSLQSPTNQSSIPVSVVFSEPVVDFVSSDLTISGGGSIQSFTGSGLTYSFILVPSLNGQMTVSLPANAVHDQAGNGNQASANFQITYIDNSPNQILSSITGPTPATGNSSTEYVWQVNFQDATEVSLSSVTVEGAGSAGCTAVVSGSGLLQRTVKVSGCSADGSFNIRVPAGSAKNAVLAESQVGVSTAAVVDNTAPTLSVGAPNLSVGTSTHSFEWLVTYAGAHTISLAAADITLSGSTAGCTKTVTTENAITRKVIISNCTGNGSLDFSIAAETASDLVGNKAAGVSSVTAVTVDNTGPTLAVSGPTPTTGNKNTEFVWSVSYADAATISLAVSDVTLAGTSLTGCTVSEVSGSGSTRSVKVTGCTAEAGSVKINIAVNSAQDSLGNQSVANTSSTAASISNALNPNDPAFANDLFITKWNTEEAGVTTAFQIRIPLEAGVTYKFAIDWGDNTPVEQVNASNLTQLNHTYAAKGIYTVKMLGSFPIIKFNNTGDRLKIQEVKQWGTNKWTSVEKMFFGCEKFQITATDAPDLSLVTSMAWMFRTAKAFNANINHWNVSTITDMRFTFDGATSFNQPLNLWNTSNVTNLSFIFNQASAFNQNISSWDTSKVTTLERAFCQATVFNQPLNSWNVSNVTTISYMFYEAKAFNQNLNSWDTSKITDFSNTFSGALVFNGDVASWNTSSATTMAWMFDGANAFNQPIGAWNTSNVVNMYSMLSNTHVFNQPLASWDVSKNTNFYMMFSHSRKFNQPLNSWNVSKVDNFGSMFSNAYAFNQPLNLWDTSAATSMLGMFNNASAFNQDIGNWNVSNVIYMTSMFSGASAFNRNINSWDISKVTTLSSMFNSASAFNQPLNNWNTGNVTDMSSMFSAAYAFNQPVGSWNVSKVTTMQSMFSLARAFNQPLNAWNTSSLNTASSMFQTATAFNQPLNSWNTDNLLNTAYMFQSASAFNQPLNNWNTSKISNMISMFQNASAFDQDLSSWNVGMVVGKTNFDTSATSWRKARPTNVGTNYSDPYPHPSLSGSEPADAFITVWRTDFSGSSTSTRITLPVLTGLTYNFTVDWGDGTAVQTVTNNSLAQIQHSYASAGKYKVIIRGTFPRFAFTEVIKDPLKLVDVLQWGTNPWTSTSSMFSGAANLRISATDSPNLSGVTDMSGMFMGASNFNTPIGHWNVSNVQSFSSMFRDAISFNQPLNAWNTGNATDMLSTFYGAKAFNQPLSGWNLGNVTMLNSMFEGALAFNQDISSWNTSKVTNMANMFRNASAFNSSIQAWDVSKVLNMSNLFSGAGGFNQPIGSWNVSSVTTMQSMFSQAYGFNQSLNIWNVSNVTVMQSMFYQANGFNMPLANWDTSKVNNMNSMFHSNNAYNQNLASWNVGLVSNSTNFSLGARAWELAKPSNW